MKKVFIFLCLGLIAASIQGCYSDQELNEANKVITALPTEVEGCVFIADVDTSAPFAHIDNARFSLKMQVAKLGGTHLVETHVYPLPLTRRMLGVGMSGKAYKCPQGKGPVVSDERALLHRDFPLVNPYDDDDDPLDPFFSRRSFFP